ncbi:RNA-binding protein [Aurantimonas sp. Leaf443]|uniref:RNA-binding protein n=1 Tax=Aurantimonas sp. Leaf443 TaxID=1736378 RepID=UPI0007014531|nr:RNA-binding protein [Aurantimonas sp. Leaf443]KQT84175.1 DNA-binding protein [Aurantimonas sp. Leaf443]
MDELVNGRMCILSRARLPADEMIRFVLGPDGTVVPDLKRRLPGRGAHVEARRASLEEAVRRKLFSRAFRREAGGTAGLADLVDALLVASTLGSMGLARKARQLVTGATRVESALRSGEALALIASRDGSADGVRKMESVRRTAASALGIEIPAYRPFSTDELGLALGGGNVIHAAILAGDAGLAAAKRLSALARYRGENPDSDSPQEPL